MKIFHCESDHTCIWMSFAQVVVGHSEPHLRPLGSIDGEFDTHSGSQSGLMPGVWHQEWSYSPLECSIAPWKRKHVKHFRDETLVLLEIIVLLSLINNWIARGSLRMGPLRSGPRCGTDGLGQYKTPGMWHSVWDGLWRPGGAFFQIGFGCVMSHHHIEGLWLALLLETILC